VAFAYEKLPIGLLGDDTWVEGLEQLRQEAWDSAKAALARLEAAARTADVPVDSRLLETTFSGTADEFGRLARRFDLSIVRQVEPRTGTADQLIVEAALFDSGRPVLIVPYAQKGAAKLDRIMLCWDGSRSAARALADALPFLQCAKIIEVFTVESGNSDIVASDIIDHLVRHGLKAQAQRVAAADVDVAGHIRSHATDAQIDLIVMGGYGHSRLREFVLGGVTRDILERMTIATLMSH
jgi:nucleotide-binding universal stress UspA family protein